MASKARPAHPALGARRWSAAAGGGRGGRGGKEGREELSRLSHTRAERERAHAVAHANNFRTCATLPSRMEGGAGAIDLRQLSSNGRRPS
eukprot:20359-Chlamydomonas_euryale.AAC.1